MQNRVFTSSDLQLADIVMDADRPHQGLMAVKQIKDGNITLFRPYPHTADFSCTSGVICYTGVEEWTVRIDDTRNQWELVSRQVVR